jgi:hypothetical protein
MQTADRFNRPARARRLNGRPRMEIERYGASEQEAARGRGGGMIKRAPRS